MDYETETPIAPVRDDQSSGLSLIEIIEQSTKIEPQAKADTATSDWIIRVDLHMGFDTYVKPILETADAVQPFNIDKEKAQVFHRKAAEWAAIHLYLFFKDIAPEGATPWEFIVEKKEATPPKKRGKR